MKYCFMIICYEGKKGMRHFFKDYFNITVEKEKEKTLYSQEELILKETHDYLNHIHPDLLNIKKELQESINNKSSNMEDILEKAKLMNQLYTDYLQHQDSIYDMIKQNNLSKNEVDAFYNQIREIRNALLGNTKNKEYYQHAQDILSHIYTNIK